MRKSIRRRRRTAIFAFCCVASLAGVGYWFTHRQSPPSASAPRVATPLNVAPTPVVASTNPPTAPALLSAETSDAGSTATPPNSSAEPAAEEILKPRDGRGVESATGPPGPNSDRRDDTGGTIERKPPPATDSPQIEPVSSGNASIDASRQLMNAGKWIEARRQLSDLLSRGLKPAEQNEARALLTQLAQETVFNRTIIGDDPLFATHVVQPGENLTVIGSKFKVPPEAIMLINGIADARKLRADQKLKVPQGPFHVRIIKSDFRLDVYLADTYIRSFRVGLGSQGGTPEGAWRVKERLENPTYYPPASATDKRIIAPDDPANPLGERWIGLEGVEGDAVGRDGYGIHGTIEPDSIGKAESAGCVRMHNEDVALLFKLMMPGHSRVAIGP